MKQRIRDIYHSVPYKYRMPLQYYSSLREANFFPDEETLKIWQLKRLKYIINYAYDNVPGYKILYDDNKIKPSDLRCLGDLVNFPMVDKELIRNNIKDFISKEYNISKLRYVQTSGSSGTPFGLYRCKRDEWVENAFVAKCWANGGWNLSQSGFMLRGAYTGDETHIISHSGNSNFYVHNNSYFVSPNFLVQEYYSIYRDFLLTNRHLSYIFAFPSCLALLSELLIKNGDAGISSVESIYLSSENVYSWQIELIKKAFPNAVVISLYGQTEHVVMAAWKSDDSRYHVVPQYGKTEILGEDGRTGEIIGTSFWSKAMPLIRYRTRDYAKLSCNYDSCSPNLVIDSIEGRLNEAVVSESGRIVSMTAVANIHGDEYLNVLKFRLFQDTPGEIRFLAVVNEFYSEIESKRIIDSLLEKLGSGFKISVDIVPDLKPSKSGKYSFLEQHLQINHTDRINY